MIEDKSRISYIIYEVPGIPDRDPRTHFMFLHDSPWNYKFLALRYKTRSFIVSKLRLGDSDILPFGKSTSRPIVLIEKDSGEVNFREMDLTFGGFKREDDFDCCYYGQEVYGDFSNYTGFISRRIKKLCTIK